MNRRQIRIFIDRVKRKFQFRSGLNFRRKRHRLRGAKVQYYSLFITEIVAVILLAFVITKCFGIRMECAGESMEPTIEENSSLWVDHVIYKFTTPKKGDVVAFLPRGNINANDSIKRIVAEPGDTVYIAKGRVFVNGEALNSYNKDDVEVKEAGRATNELVLGEDEYFVLGDNINNSEDSRYESVGNVKKSEIKGKVWFKLALKNFGFVE